MGLFEFSRGHRFGALPSSSPFVFLMCYAASRFGQKRSVVGIARYILLHSAQQLTCPGMPSPFRQAPECVLDAENSGPLCTAIPSIKRKLIFGNGMDCSRIACFLGGCPQVMLDSGTTSFACSVHAVGLPADVQKHTCNVCGQILATKTESGVVWMYAVCARWSELPFCTQNLCVDICGPFLLFTSSILFVGWKITGWATSFLPTLTTRTLSHMCPSFGIPNWVRLFHLCLASACCALGLRLPHGFLSAC